VLDLASERKRVHAGEKGIQDSILHFLYQTKPGSILLKALVNPYVSKATGYFMDSGLSVPLVKPFIKCNNINIHTCNILELYMYIYINSR